MGGTAHKSQGYKLPTVFFLRTSLPSLPSSPLGSPPPPPAAGGLQPTLATLSAFRPPRPPGPLSLPLAFPTSGSLLPPPPILNHGDLLRPGVLHRLGPPVSGRQARGFGGQEQSRAHQAPSPAAPGPSRPPQPGGRSLRLQKAGPGLGIPGSRLPGWESRTSESGPLPSPHSGPLTPSCPATPRAPPSPPQAGCVRWGPTVPREGSGGGQASLARPRPPPPHPPPRRKPPAPCPSRAR